MPAKKRKTSKRTSGKARGSRSSLSGSVDSALQSVARAMKRVKARWYLFGAQAVALHGVPRTTRDIDVTALVEATTPALLAALRAEGIVPRFEDPAFVATTRVIPADHVESGWSVDIVLGGPGLEQQIAAEATPRQVGRVKVPLISLEHLVVLKVLAARPQDLADVARLLDLHRDTIELDAVRALLRELEQALSEDGIVARLTAIAAATPQR